MRKLLRETKIIKVKHRLFMKLMLLVAAASSYAQGPNDSGDYYQNADGDDVLVVGRLVEHLSTWLHLVFSD